MPITAVLGCSFGPVTSNKDNILIRSKPIDVLENNLEPISFFLKKVCSIPSYGSYLFEGKLLYMVIRFEELLLFNPILL